MAKICLALQMQPLVVTLLLAAAATTKAQDGGGSPPGPGDQGALLPAGWGSTGPVISLLLAIIAVFFILTCFSIFARQCGRAAAADASQAGAAGRTRKQTRGLDKEVIESLPVMSYEKARELRIGKGALECAVCLSEFEDDDELKLLPRCSHVFHPDCIDSWFAGHSTCPVCRFDLQSEDGTVPTCTLNSDHHHADYSNSGAAASRNEESEPREDAAAAPVPVVVIDVNEGSEDEEQRRREEDMELQRIGSQRRAVRSKAPIIRRSHSTGHSLTMGPDGNSLDRYTLRLPEIVRKELIAAGEESVRRGKRAVSRGGRSLRFGRSDRWPSFLSRTLSTRVPFWPRKVDGDESVRRRESEGESVKRAEQDKEPSTNGEKRGASAAAMASAKVVAACEDDVEAAAADSCHVTAMALQN